MRDSYNFIFCASLFNFDDLNCLCVRACRILTSPVGCLQLEMERALLEGEQQNELELLMSEQKRIADLKRQRLQLTDQATAKQEQVRE